MDDIRTPGDLIDLLLSERRWDKKALATVIGIDPGNLHRIIAGRRRLDAVLAVALSEAFGVPAERFLDLQQANDLALARASAGESGTRATNAALFGNLPITEMIHRGWLNVPNARHITAVEGELMKFFGVTSIGDIEILPHAAKKTDVAAPATPAQIAWIYRVRQLAREMVLPRYTRKAAHAAVERLKALLMSAEEARHVSRILTDCGIRFVIVESLRSAKIDGVCLWLDDNSPVIGLSLRLDRIDNFWFVLRHELEHVIRGHGKNTIALDADLTGARAGLGNELSDDERAANLAAADFCVPVSSMNQFVTRKAPLFLKRDLLGFARTIQVHPGIVAGQLQHRTERYNLFREYQVKMRSAVSVGAPLDGWGDVFPVSAQSREQKT